MCALFSYLFVIMQNRKDMLKSQGSAAKTPRTSPKPSTHLFFSKKGPIAKSSINMRSSCEQYFANNKYIVRSHINGQKIRSSRKIPKDSSSQTLVTTREKTSLKYVKKRPKKISAGKQTTRESASDIKQLSPNFTTRGRTLKVCKSDYSLRKSKR